MQSLVPCRQCSSRPLSAPNTVGEESVRCVTDPFQDSSRLTAWTAWTAESHTIVVVPWRRLSRVYVVRLAVRCIESVYSVLVQQLVPFSFEFSASIQCRDVVPSLSRDAGHRLKILRAKSMENHCSALSIELRTQATPVNSSESHHSGLTGEVRASIARQCSQFVRAMCSSYLLADGDHNDTDDRVYSCNDSVRRSEPHIHRKQRQPVPRQATVYGRRVCAYRKI